MKNLRKSRLQRKAAAAALALILLIPAAAPVTAASYNSVERMKEVLLILEEKHVSAPSDEKLSEIAIESMIKALNDPYTTYFTKEELNAFSNAVENKYVGIGIRVSQEPDGVYVAQVFDGPSKTAGLQAGDVIVQIEDTTAVGLPLDQAISKIKGEPGTKVKLTITRAGQTFEAVVERQQIQIPVVSAKKLDPAGVGYIRISSFSSDAADLTKKELGTLNEQGIRSLIIDLRDNGGGLLDTAKHLARLFVKEGTLIHTKDRDNVDDPVTFAGGTTQAYPVYILVNEESASASEVLTGALQDYGAAKAIGTKTFGKGSVQEVINLPSGGAVKVTVEEYLTPKQRKVNGVGLQPDIPVEGGEMTELLTALRTAGLTELSVELSRRNVTVNGVPFEDTFPVLRENGQTYVPTRVLAAVLGASVQWNDAARSVEIKSADGAAVFAPAGDGLVMKGNTSFVSVDKAASVFSGLVWSDNGTKLTLKAAK